MAGKVKASPKIPQLSFNAGEISPEASARTDLELYGKSVAKMSNMIPRISGGAESRTGFEVLARCKNVTASRLIEFKFNNEQVYVIELGEYYMRFFKDAAPIYGPELTMNPVGSLTPGVTPIIDANQPHGYLAGQEVIFDGMLPYPDPGGFIEEPLIMPLIVTAPITANTFGLNVNGSTWAIGNGGTVKEIFEVVTPYSEADLEKLKYTQSGDVMTFTHTGHPVYELARGESFDYEWTMLPMTFGSNIEEPSRPKIVRHVGFTDATGIYYEYAITAVDWRGVETLQRVVDSDDKFEYFGDYETTNHWKDSNIANASSIFGAYDISFYANPNQAGGTTYGPSTFIDNTGAASFTAGNPPLIMSQLPHNLVAGNWVKLTGFLPTPLPGNNLNFPAGPWEIIEPVTDLTFTINVNATGWGNGTNGKYEKLLGYGKQEQDLNIAEWSMASVGGETKLTTTGNYMPMNQSVEDGHRVRIWNVETFLPTMVTLIGRDWPVYSLANTNECYIPDFDCSGFGPLTTYGKLLFLPPGYNLDWDRTDVQSYRIYRKDITLYDSVYGNENFYFQLLAEVLQADITRKIVDGATFDGAGGGPVPFVDFGNITPDPSTTTLKPRSPFGQAGEYPGAVEYNEQRLALAGSDEDIQAVWTSAASGFRDFNTRKFVKETDPVQMTLGSRRPHQIRHLLNIGTLIALTADGEWMLTDAGDLLTPSSGNPKMPTSWGSSHVRPGLFGSSALFVTDDRKSVRDIQFVSEGGPQTILSSDLNYLAYHLFEERQIVDVAVEEKRNHCAWLAMDDGDLTAVTYHKQNEVVAWHQHAITGGDCKALGQAFEQDEDFLYAIVEREHGSPLAADRYVERKHSRIRSSFAGDRFMLDGAVEFNADVWNIVDPTGTGYQPAWAAYWTFNDSGYTPYTPLDRFRLFGPATPPDLLSEFGAYYMNFDLFGVPLPGFVFLAHVDTGAAIYRPTAFPTGESPGYVQRAYNSFSGMQHLYGTTFSVVADGRLYENQTCDVYGVWNMPAGEWASNAIFGHMFTQELDTLDINDAQGTSIGTSMAIPSVTTTVSGTKVFELSQDGETWVDAGFPVNAVANEEYTGSFETSIISDFNPGAHVKIRQTKPEHMFIQSIIPKVEPGA